MTEIETSAELRDEMRRENRKLRARVAELEATNRCREVLDEALLLIQEHQALVCPPSATLELEHVPKAVDILIQTVCQLGHTADTSSTLLSRVVELEAEAKHDGELMRQRLTRIAELEAERDEARATLEAVRAYLDSHDGVMDTGCVRVREVLAILDEEGDNERA